VDLEASVGLYCRVTNASKFTVGYRAEALSGVNDFNGAGDNQLVSGRFEL
jgi:hypothetical protein